MTCVIGIDIDGVLLHGSTPIEGSAEGLLTLQKAVCKRPQFCPQLYILTNRGNMLEEQCSELLNEKLGLEEKRLEKHQIVLNFTAMRPYMSQYQDKYVLIVGRADYTETLYEVLKTGGINKAITVQEYLSLFPDCFPFPQDPETLLKSRQKTIDRLQINEEELEDFQVRAIFILLMPTQWEEVIQVILDLLTTPDGRVAKSMPKQAPDTHIPIYCGYNEFSTKMDFHLPRLANGSFIMALKQVYLSIFKKPLETIQFFGKPNQGPFNFIKESVESTFKPEDINRYYMVGDTPCSDIRGGNASNWTTILVKTGVFLSEDKLEGLDKPNYIVENFYEAVQLIIQLEGLTVQ